MKIRDLRLDDSVSVDARDIPIDTVFSATICGLSSVFLKAKDIVVDLYHPYNVWNDVDLPLPSVSKYTRFSMVKNYIPLSAQLVVGSKDKHS